MEISNGKSGVAPNRGYHLVRVVVAVVLLAAAALKCHQLASEPIIGSSPLESRWLLLVTVEFELFFGIWLLANIWAKPTWAAALTCFGLFTCVSLCKAILGHASCGCFGRVSVNPWYTTVFDLAIVLSVLRWRPKGQDALSAVSVSPVFMRAMGVLLVWLSVGLPAAYAISSCKPTTLSEAGDIIGNGRIVVLEPEKWVGNRFPLLPFVEDYPGRPRSNKRLLRECLAEGKWLVVLYHHDCPRCIEAIPRYKELACRSVADTTLPQVAMIEVPPYEHQDSLQLLSDLRCAFGRLSDVKDWFVEGPVDVVCSHGIVEETNRSEAKW